MTSKEARLNTCSRDLQAISSATLDFPQDAHTSVSQHGQKTQNTLAFIYSPKYGYNQRVSQESLHRDTDSQKRIIINDTFFTQSVLTLTTGVFITGFALKMHAPAGIVGLLVAIPSLAQLLQLPSVALVGHCHSLKGLIIQSTLISRLTLLLLAVIPFFPSNNWTLAILVFSFALYACLTAVATCAWNAWVRDTVKSEELGSFFSKKLALSSLITLALTFFGGLFIDWGAVNFAKIHIPVYSILFLFTALLGIAGVYPFRKIRDRNPSPALKHFISSETFHILSTSMLDEKSIFALKENALQKSGGIKSGIANLFKPFKELNYRNLIGFLTIYDFSINLAIPFLTVYMLNTLHYSMGLVSAITIVSQVTNYFFLPTWGRVADRFSNRAVLMLCGPIQLFCIFAWCCFVLPGVSDTTLPTIIAIYMLLGVGTAGVSLANGNIAMKLSPADRGAPHMACTNVMASLASGASPLVTGWASQTFTHINIGIPGFENSCWYFIFSLACLLGCVGLVQLTRVEESGTVRTRQLIYDLLIEPTQKHIRHSIS